MVTLDFKTLIAPEGILRILEVIFLCVILRLVLSVSHQTNSFWIYCMFTWCFCVCVTILILVLEFLSLSSKLPISWDDFTTAFAMVATLMVLTASIFYSMFYTCRNCGRQIGANVISFLTFILYIAEVGLIRSKPGETSRFISTVPGLLKVLEAFVACVIFFCLPSLQISHFGLLLQSCIAVYSTCFLFSILIIFSAIGRMKSRSPTSFNRVLIVCNVLAVLMYITAVVIWPFYCFRTFPRPKDCRLFCWWNLIVVICVLSSLNLIAYIVDTVFSFKLVFFTPQT
ncbi:myeloid-associated differentiation marker homolog [Cyprinodon tularosa]|uniref:myeloid-associated differentiation marker homolog n=1 Tax=Cyprinodon tularosa TaxID=77115 RepID=UPI0018E1DFD0|nr:myeloid-associated differentiation marker homolog [Cyprinodon tularosa]